MAKNYAVVRTDRMEGTGDRNSLISIKYIKNDEETEIQNGSVLKRGALMDGEREVFAGADVAAADALDDVVLVCSPELMYDERLRNLDDFINEAGKIARAYHLRKGDIFSVTAEALAFATSEADDGKVGSVVELKAGTKLQVVKAATGATSGSTVVGKIIAIETVGKYTYYVVLVG